MRQYLRDYTVSYGTAADLQVGRQATVRLPGLVETVLNRIIQEAMTNTAKPSSARHMSVVLDHGASMVDAVVEDDGCGFQA